MSECCSGGKTRILYACSGASDVGQIADKTARKLSKDGYGNMTCLAAIGAHLSGFVESAKATTENIAIDGCPVACSRKNLEHIGVTPKSYILTEMGLVKGKTKVTDEVVNKMSEEIKRQDQKVQPAEGGSDKGSCCCG
jgi:uncharacterized metal-binding protein